jgi:hypothetical protein
MSSVIDKTEDAIKNKPVKLDKGDRSKLTKLDKNAKWKDIKNVSVVNDAIQDLDIYEERIGLGCSRYLQEAGVKGTFDKEEMFRNCREADIVNNRVSKQKKREEAKASKMGRRGRGGGVSNDKKLLTPNAIPKKVEKPKELDNYKPLTDTQMKNLKQEYDKLKVKHTEGGNTNWEDLIKDFAINATIGNCLNSGLNSAGMILAGITKTVGNVGNAYMGWENGEWVISNNVYSGLTDLVKNCGFAGSYMIWLNWKNIKLWLKGGELPNEGRRPPNVNPDPDIGGGGGGGNDDDDDDDNNGGGGGDTTIEDKGELTPPPVSNDAFHTFMLQQQAQAQAQAQVNSRTRMFESSSVGEPSSVGLTPQGELNNTGRPISIDEIQEMVGKGSNTQTGYGESIRDIRDRSSNLIGNEKMKMGGIVGVKEGLVQGATLLSLGGMLGGLHNAMGNPFSTPVPEIPVEQVVEGVSLDADLAEEIRQEQDQDLAEEKGKKQQDEMTRQINEMSKAYGKGIILGQGQDGGKFAMGIDSVVSSLVGSIGIGERAYQSLQERQELTQEQLIREQSLTAGLQGRLDTITEAERERQLEREQIQLKAEIAKRKREQKQMEKEQSKLESAN